MKIKYSKQAIECITEIGEYLKQSELPSGFIRSHLNDLKLKIEKLLTTFPDSGHKLEIDKIILRRIVVNKYVVLYRFTPPLKLIEISYIHKQNLPKIEQK